MAERYCERKTFVLLPFAVSRALKLILEIAAVFLTQSFREVYCSGIRKKLNHKITLKLESFKTASKQDRSMV